MAKIDRYNGNLEAFGSAATGTERTVFGDVTQADTLDANITADFLRGWGIVGVNENPSKQDFNGLAFTLGQLISYLHQRGVPEWNTAQEYYEGSVVTTLAGVYRLLSGGDGSIDPDVDAGFNWEKAPTRGEISQPVDSVAALQALTIPDSLERIYLEGYNGQGTAGAGELYIDRADTTSPDNGIDVFVSANGLRVKRVNPVSKDPHRILGDGPYIVVATGQSNMVGRCTGGTFKINPKVKIWNISNDQFETADFENVTYTLDMGAGDTAGGGKNNAGVAFCHRLQEETGEDVYLILNARGGSSITNWDTGTYTTTLKSTIANALADPTAPGKTTVDCLMWMQGEKDLQELMDFDTYSGHFENFINSLDAESYFEKPTVPIITVPVSRFYIYESGPFEKTDVQEFLEGLGNKFTSKYGRTLVSNPSNLTNCDVSHYDGASLYELGYNRFYQSLLKIDDQGDVGGAPLLAPVIRPEKNRNYFGAGLNVATLYDSATWGDDNIALVTQALFKLSAAGTRNTVVGANGLRGYQTIGSANIAIGDTESVDLLDPNAPAGVMGSGNVVIGSRTAPEITLGAFEENTLIGLSAAYGVSSLGTGNLIQGVRVGRADAIGDSNVVLGDRAVSTSLAAMGSDNVAAGLFALGGEAAAGTLGTGFTRHTAIGAYAASHLNTDSGPNASITCIGAKSGRVLQSAANMTAAGNVTCLGFEASISGDNQVQLGNSATTTYAYGAVQDRSDARDKADIQDLTDAHIAFFMAVEWKQYRLDYREDYFETIETDNGLETIIHEKDGSKARSRLHIGAIAQQVEQAMIEHGVDFAGLQHHSVNGGCDVYTLGYQEFIGIQGEIIQRQQKRLDAIEGRLSAAGI